MRRRLTAITLALLASLVLAGPAFADNYFVTELPDSSDPPACSGSSPSFTCTTLRAAVDAANVAADADIIVLGVPGAFVLSAGPLTLANNVTIGGGGTDTNALVGTTVTRAITVAAGASVSLTGMTVRGGSLSSEDGGNILVNPGAQLALTLVRVTGGSAERGGGIANLGALTVNSSVIDNNVARLVGGAVYNNGTLGAAQLTVVNSTLAKNIAPAGGAVYSAGNPGNTVHLSYATVGRNNSGGLGFDSAQTAVAEASILANNSGPDCQGAPVSGTASVESGTSCGFTGAGNRQNADPGFSPDLVNAGSEVSTQVLTIPATSPAVDLVNPCTFPYDQRIEPRFSAAGAPCDAGAFELAPSGSGGQPPPPPPPPPTPTPVPTATPTPEPTPTLNKSVVAEPVKGKVLVKEKGKNTFVELSEAAIGNGSEVDTRKGTVEITTSAGDVAQFHDGIFKVSQSGGITTLTLSEKLTGCPKKSGRASAAATKPKSRKLWGDGKGKFRTKGQYGAATIRGTEWLVQDTCTTTFFRTKVGTVKVRDDVKKKTIVLRAPKSYTARARK
jgi:hypothetical protein